MASTMVRSINGGGAFVTLRTFEQATFIRIDIAEECPSDYTTHYFQSLTTNSFAEAKDSSSNYL